MKCAGLTSNRCSNKLCAATAISWVDALTDGTTTHTTLIFNSDPTELGSARDRWLSYARLRGYDRRHTRELRLGSDAPHGWRIAPAEKMYRGGTKLCTQAVPRADAITDTHRLAREAIDPSDSGSDPDSRLL